MPNLIERLDAVLASLTTDDPKQANGKAMVFLLENNLTLREALRDAGRYHYLRLRVVPEELMDEETAMFAQRSAGAIMSRPPDGDPEIDAELDAALDAAIDQERGDA